MNRSLFPALKSRLSQLQQRRRDYAGEARQVCALTERRQVDRRHHHIGLQHREYRLRAIAQAAGVGVFDLDYAGAGDYFSAELKAIAGLSGELGDFSLERAMEVVHPEDRERVVGKIEASLNPQGDGVFEDEHRLLLPDGSVRWIRAQGRTFFAEDAGRRPLGTTGIMIDVTERKREQAEREADGIRLAAILDSLTEGVVIFDLGGKVLNVNPAALDLMGYQDAAEARLRLPEFTNVFEVLSLEGRSLPLEEWPIGKVVAGESFSDYEVEVRRKDYGTSIIISHNGTTVPGSDGMPVLGVLTMRDVSDRRHTEEALRRESSRLQSILDNAPVLISIKDLEGRMVLANRAVFETVEVPPPEEFIGRSVFDLFPREVAEKLWANDLEALENDGPIRAEEQVRHRDGSLHTYLTVKFPVRDVHSGQSRSLCAISIDITERKVAEAEARSLNAELEQRVRKRTAELQRANDALLRSNLELRHFAHAAAHDLQTPLRSIAGFAQLLQREVHGQADGRVDEWATLVIDNAKRLQTLIQELLAYTRLDVQGLPFEAVDLHNLIGEVLASLAGLISETGAEVNCESLPTALVDRTQIAQLLQNLVENGIKYNKSKPPRVDIACRRQGNEWVISVADNGIGIDPRHHDRIFEIFRRLHSYSQVAGTGIGLALCRRIVERHGGRIWVESQPGEGSTFRFTLPMRTKVD